MQMACLLDPGKLNRSFDTNCACRYRGLLKFVKVACRQLTKDSNYRRHMLASITLSSSHKKGVLIILEWFSRIIRLEIRC